MGSPVQVYWVKHIDNSRLVRQRHPGSVRETALLVAGAMVCLTVVLLCAWQDFAYVHAGYRLEKLREHHAQVLEWNRTLRLEQAALLDPMRIDAVARNRLGLEAPPAGQLLPLGAQPGSLTAPLLAAEVPAPARPPARRATRDSFAD